MKLKKRKNQLRFKKKLVTVITLIILMMLGIGYSFLSANLNIKGNIFLKSNRLENTSKFTSGTIVNNKRITRSESIPDNYKNNNYIVSDMNLKNQYIFGMKKILFIYIL